MAQSPVRVNRAEVIRDLSKQLRWHDEAEHNEYERTKVALTERLLEEVDGFVIDNFLPATTTADSVRQAVDALLGYKQRDIMHNVAFSVTLAEGRFLIVGVELWRGGEAIAENAISFRAFGQRGSRLVLVANTEVWDGAEKWAGVMRLHAKPLPTSPMSGESWFFALGQVNPSLTPPEIAVKLWAFDGKHFRAVWTPKYFCAEGPAEAVELNTGGFVINRLLDPTGEAARSPTLVVHERFLFTADGPQKTGQWETQRR
jgi:hypothetical protein